MDTRGWRLDSCSGDTGKPNMDACELHKVYFPEGNGVLPCVARQAFGRFSDLKSYANRH